MSGWERTVECPDCKAVRVLPGNISELVEKLHQGRCLACRGYEFTEENV